jgi:hypothetical protein
MLCHWKGPAAALQIRENPISTFSMKGLEPLPEQPLKFHVGLPLRLSSLASLGVGEEIAIIGGHRRNDANQGASSLGKKTEQSFGL